MKKPFTIVAIGLFSDFRGLVHVQGNE